MTVAIEYGSAAATLADQARSGDRALIVPLAHGALIAMIDGLGHGEEAARAADAAASELERDASRPVEELIARCHDRLRSTRGAAISLASLDARHAVMRWIGIGNVDGVLVHSVPLAKRDDSLITSGGIVGYRMPRVAARELALRAGDTLVLATDGVRQGFREQIQTVRDPQDIADRILAGYAKGSDDACVVVARFRGELDDARRIDVEGEADVARARIRARDHAKALGFQNADIEAFATAVSELVRNVLVHAEGGDIAFVPLHDAGRAGLAAIVRDRGPGIADVARALDDDYSTAGGLGCGLSGARRLVDDLQVETQLGTGTVITITKWVR